MHPELVKTLIAITGKAACFFLGGGEETDVAKYFKCFTAPQNNPPASAFATLALRNSHPILQFDQTTPEDAIFADAVPAVFTGSAGLSVIIVATTTVTSGDAIVEVAIERDNSGFNIDSDSFAAGVSGTLTAPAASGNLVYLTIALSSAQIDGLTANERYRLRLRRNAGSGSDTMAADLQVLAVIVQEA